MDEAHKLPETARQMFGVTLEKEDIRSLTNSLRCERYVLAAESLGSAAAPLLRKLAHPPDGRPFEHYARSLAAPERSLTVIQRQLHGLLKAAGETSKDIAKRLTNLEEKLAVDIRSFL